MKIILSCADPEPFQKEYIRQFRRIFRLNFDGVYIGWQRLRVGSDEWQDCPQGWYVFLWSWAFKVEHIYYDGCNCSWRFGWLAIQRHGMHCKKCMGE